MDGIFRIIGAKRTNNGWRFVAEPEHCTIEFTCSNPETDMMAWRVLKEEFECEIRFNDEGKADLIGVVPDKTEEAKHGRNTLQTTDK